jgi:hypothetical protein
LANRSFAEHITAPGERLRQAGDALFSSFVTGGDNAPYFSIGAIFTFIGALLDDTALSAGPSSPRTPSCGGWRASRMCCA